MNTFGEIVQELRRHMFDPGTPGGDTRARLWANMGYMRVVYDVDYPFLRREVQFQTVAGQRLYIPKDDLLWPLNLRIPDKNLYLIKLAVEKMDRSRPQYVVDTKRGAPQTWYVEDFVGSLTQPTSATQIRAVSSSTADTISSNTNVTIEGVVSGEVDREVLAINGTTAVTSTKLFSEIHKISKNRVTAGQISVTNPAQTMTFAVLGPYHRTKSFLRIGLNPIPDQAYTVYGRYIPWLPELVNDSDVPHIPTKDVPIIVDAAMLIAAEWMGQPEVVAIRERRYAEKIRKIREAMGHDDDSVGAWSFVRGDSPQNLPQPGDYNAFLRSLYWGGV
jgi:hypothetical protein